MSEKRIYKISIICNQQNNGEIQINNFFNYCDFPDATDAYIMIDKALGIRENAIDISNLGVYCNGLKDVFDNTTINNLKISTQLDIIPSTFIRSVANAVLSNTYFNLTNQLDNWTRLSLSQLNNLNISVNGLTHPFENGIDFELVIVLKIKLIKK